MVTAAKNIPDPQMLRVHEDYKRRIINQALQSIVWDRYWHIDTSLQTPTTAIGEVRTNMSAGSELVLGLM